MIDSIAEDTSANDSTIKTLRCEMQDGCMQPVTHIGEKGFIYCTEHARIRKGRERCRRMRKWELVLINSGKPLPSYKPIRKREAVTGVPLERESVDKNSTMRVREWKQR